MATSIVNDIENGIRIAGSKTLDKIAYGLELSNEERFKFIMIGMVRFSGAFGIESSALTAWNLLALPEHASLKACGNGSPRRPGSRCQSTAS